MTAYGAPSTVPFPYPAIGRHVSLRSRGLLFKHGLNLRTQAIETTPHIGHSGGDPYLGSGAKIDHLRKLSRINLNNAGSAPLSALITALPGNSM
jgi:hypothetical protein